MTDSIPTRAFLELRSNVVELDVPDSYKQAIPHESVPFLFYLPWPVELIPQLRSEIHLSGLPLLLSKIRPGKTTYLYDRDTGVTAYIEVDWGCEKIDIRTLLCLSQEGFLAEVLRQPGERWLIEDLLAKSGLPKTIDEYHNKT